jgi:hypothetical protein
MFPVQMFNIYIKRASDAFGVVYTRQIYEKAIEQLPDDHAVYHLLTSTAKCYITVEVLLFYAVKCV